ncbi:hypothetical protein [Glycomyces tritici]|uniref:Uncharacterized protein n=1 Tax=Glycomyces tritici TaxID=2665176 RepID=A0ABT7YQ40_9ACTN|nr:hypothetical protein [Glycomyces tritici]MDN3240706.1 hypothetical protein [Glycomyces tritici]
MRKLAYDATTTLSEFITGPGNTGRLSVTPDVAAFLTEHFPEALSGPARKALGVGDPVRRFDTALNRRATYEPRPGRGHHRRLPHLRRHCDS